MDPSPAPKTLTHLSSQVVSRGQVFKTKQAVPVPGSTPAWVMLDHLIAMKGTINSHNTAHIQWGEKATYNKDKTIAMGSIYKDKNDAPDVLSLSFVPPLQQSPNFLLTSTSHNALLLVAEVADWRPVVRRKTYCFFRWSSQVRNFSCSAWNSRTTSPWERHRNTSLPRSLFHHNWPL